jgi:GT2 family glycosyltransferase
MATGSCMIDDDQVFHADILMKLLARDKDVIAPLILERHFPYKPVAFRNINGERQSVLMNGLQEVDALGTGIFLMKRKVWETVGKFRYSGEVIKEDLDYCQRIKAAGFSIFCDFSLPAGHMTPFAVWPLANGKVGLRNHNKTHVVDRT